MGREFRSFIQGGSPLRGTPDSSHVLYVSPSDDGLAVHKMLHAMGAELCVRACVRVRARVRCVSLVNADQQLEQRKV